MHFLNELLGENIEQINYVQKTFHIECDSWTPPTLGKPSEETMCDIVPFAFNHKMNGIFVYSPDNLRIVDSQLVLEYQKTDNPDFVKITDKIWYVPFNEEHYLSANGEEAIDMSQIFSSRMRFHCYDDIVANIRIYGLGIVDS